jgi:hypothetical protein
VRDERPGQLQAQSDRIRTAADESIARHTAWVREEEAWLLQVTRAKTNRLLVCFCRIALLVIIGLVFETGCCYCSHLTFSVQELQTASTGDLDTAIQQQSKVLADIQSSAAASDSAIPSSTQPHSPAIFK